MAYTYIITRKLKKPENWRFYFNGNLYHSDTFFINFYVS